MVVFGRRSLLKTTNCFNVVKIQNVKSTPLSPAHRTFTMASQAPKTMKAIVINENKAKVASDVPVPKLRPTYVLARVDSIALNPTDWKHIAGKRAAAGCISGCDFSGTVVEVGADVTKSLKPGDRIAATTQYVY